MDEPRFPIEGARRLVAVVLDPKGERLDLCLSGPGFDWGGWFTVPAQRGVRRTWTDSRASYTGSAPWAATSAAWRTP